LKGWEHFRSLGPLYFASMTMFIVLGLIAAFTRSARYHAVFAVFFFVYNGVMLSQDVLRMT